MHRIFIYAVAVLFIVVANVAIGISDINSTDPEIQYKASGWLLSAFNKAIKFAKSPTKPELSKKTIKKSGTPAKKKHKKTPKARSALSSHPKAYVAPKSVKMNAKAIDGATKPTKSPTKSKLSKKTSKNPDAFPKKIHKVQQSEPKVYVVPKPAKSNKKIHKAQQAYVVPKPTKASIDSLNSKTIKSIGNTGKKSAIGRPYLGVVAGVGIGKVGSERQLDTTALAEDNEYKEYLPASNFYNVPVYGINGGYEFMGSSNGLLSLGVGVYQNSNYRGNGQVWLVYEFDGKYHTSDYEYKLQSTRFMLETQFAWQFEFEKIKLIPFVSLGAGPSLNFASSYKETIVDPNMPEQSEFRSNRNTSFAYQLGAGIAYPFNADCDRLFIAYRYVDLGTAQLNTTGVVGATYQISVEKNRSNEIYIGYTHLFGF